MLVDIGPVCMAITTERSLVPCEPDILKVEGFVKDILSELRDYLPVLRQRAYRIKRTNSMPSIVKSMVEAAKLVDEENLTPMACIAGAVSDHMKNYLNEEGFDFISVNNGGDISIFNNNAGRTIRVAIGNINKKIHTPYILRIEGLMDFGIATSGVGGRSLSLGLAEIGTVIAKTGAIADAAATYICNYTNIESPKIKRKKAIEVDPTTDIPDELVTVDIGQLNQQEINNALHNGLNYAYKLLKQNIIIDAFISLKDTVATTITGEKYIKLEVSDGD
ncbi:MAG: hypothetical protein N3D15_00840 [Syntrophorhabdaceae bacterium]|nr:hypothetical protein [Syntrophorhabdaceae bacterium]